MVYLVVRLLSMPARPIRRIAVVVPSELFDILAEHIERWNALRLGAPFTISSMARMFLEAGIDRMDRDLAVEEARVKEFRRANATGRSRTIPAVKARGAPRKPNR